MTKDEALKMAIEALEQYVKVVQHKFNAENWGDIEDGGKPAIKAIQACKDALEQPAQEPVAWNEEEFNAIAYAYRAFPSSEVKMVSEKYKALVDYVLSIANPAPSWKGLSDDEIEYWECLKAPPVHPDFLEDDSWREFARCIEQALKDKNL